jgi:hypothetical protein
VQIFIAAAVSVSPSSLASRAGYGGASAQVNACRSSTPGVIPTRPADEPPDIFATIQFSTGPSHA